jgi:hypothetical protein
MTNMSHTEKTEGVVIKRPNLAKRGWRKFVAFLRKIKSGAAYSYDYTAARCRMFAASITTGLARYVWHANSNKIAADLTVERQLNRAERRRLAREQARSERRIAHSRVAVATV